MEQANPFCAAFKLKLILALNVILLQSSIFKSAYLAMLFKNVSGKYVVYIAYFEKHQVFEAKRNGINVFEIKFDVTCTLCAYKMSIGNSNRNFYTRKSGYMLLRIFYVVAYEI